MATQTFNPTIDSFMDAVRPTTNYGANASLDLGAAYIGSSKTTLRRPILNFDLSGLPAGAVVTSAKLTVEVTNVQGSGVEAKVSRCTRPADWVEGEVTWDDYKASTPWTSGGGDFDDTGPPAVVTFTMPTSTGSFDITGLKDLAQDAFDNRSGILSIIKRLTAESPGVSERFVSDSRSGATPPVLEVVYSGGAPDLRRRRGRS